MQADKPKDAGGVLSGHHTMNLETYRKNGDAVKSPVWCIFENGQVFFRTQAKSGKAKRIRRNPSVRFAPCDIRGRIKGEWLKGTAGLYPGADAKAIEKRIRSKHGIAGWLLSLIEQNNSVYSIKPEQ